MRARIVFLLLETPMHVQAIANALQIDYKTALYHIERMQKEGWILRDGTGYGVTYKTTFTPEQRAAFHALAGEMGQSLKSMGKGDE